MLKNILVALDESPSSDTAQVFSIQLASRMKAHLTGIAVLNEPWITAPEALPIGGAAYKVELDQEVLQDAKKRIKKLEKSFLNACETMKCPHSLLDTTGIPAFEIEKTITPYDVLVIGNDADFHFHPVEGTAVSVQQLGKDNPRPLIVTHKEHAPGEGFLMAYDGTFASSRALHMVLLLGIATKKNTHIVTVGKERGGLEELAGQARKLCLSHGVDAQIHTPINTSASDAILNLANTVKPEIIGVGAFGQQGLMSIFRGSCTRQLLDHADRPLFIYH